MVSGKSNTSILIDVKVATKLKLAALWTALMFSYIYNDFFYLYRPGQLEHMIEGYMGPFPASQASILSGMILMTIPTLMIFLSLALPAKANRWTNLITGILYIVVAIPNVIGETMVFYIFGNIVQVALLVFIVWYAWKWPRNHTL